MRFSLPSLAKVQGGFLKYSLDRLTPNPHRAQKKLLFDILRKNKDSEYGQAFGFSKIRKEKDFPKHIPINQYQDLEPYIDKIKSGQQKVLTNVAPVMFNLTSGTTDKPKYIPVTEATNRRTKLLMYQWLFRALLDHPSFLDKKILLITSAATEGYTTAGVPYGSVSGAIYQRLPRRIRSAYALPALVSAIKNYELRYYVMARIAMEAEVSFIATPNPTTLLKLAASGIQYQEEIVQSIYEGALFTRSKFHINATDTNI
ncbi:MAG: GH3 auxin-responsive promoter family protein, partial [Elusimicrobia bacterium]|nr:GH3 auxin-responsive promoter family protein [Elusimicrobiota bacterium]